jgi:hypothetical protein
MDIRYSNAHLSIYKMGDVFAFVIKGDMPTFMMGDMSTFVIK